MDLVWQYCTISEKRRAKAVSETSCLPRDSDLSRMDVLGRITGAGVDEDIDMVTAVAEAAEALVLVGDLYLTVHGVDGRAVVHPRVGGVSLVCFSYSSVSKFSCFGVMGTAHGARVSLRLG